MSYKCGTYVQHAQAFPSEKRGPDNPRPPCPCSPLEDSGLHLEPQFHPLHPGGLREEGFSPGLLVRGKALSPVAKGGTVAEYRGSPHTRTAATRIPHPPDLASEHPGRIWAALTAAGHPHCDLGCGTLREEGTSVRGVGSWSVQGGCQGSGGARVRTILADTRANQDPPL